MVCHCNILRALLVPSREIVVRSIEVGIPAVGNVNGPDRVARGHDGTGNVLVGAVDFLVLGALAVSVELRGVAVAVAGDVEVVVATAGGTA